MKMTSKAPLSRLLAKQQTKIAENSEAKSNSNSDEFANIESMLKDVSANILERPAADCLTLTEWEWMTELPSRTRSECAILLDFIAARSAPPVQTALQLLKNTQFTSTGLVELDSALGGGFRTGHLTEIVGRAGTGKSQFCLTMCAHTVKKGRGVVYFDSERKFSPERFRDIVVTIGGRTEDASRAIVVRVDDKSCSEMLAMFKGLEPNMIEQNVGLVVVDSIAAIIRAEKVNMVERQSILAKTATELKLFSEMFRIPIVVTNQVLGVAQEDDTSFMSSGNVTPALGNTWHHVVNVRLFLSIAYPSESRAVRIMKSPDAVESTIEYAISREGITPPVTTQKSVDYNAQAAEELKLLSSLSPAELADLLV